MSSLLDMEKYLEEYKQIFEKLSWVILAISNKNNIDNYFINIKVLKKNLETKYNLSKDTDNTIKKDFPIMINDLQLLMKYIDKISKSDKIKNLESVENHVEIESDYSTLCELQCRFNNDFKKFGWMILIYLRLLNNLYTDIDVIDHKKNKLNLYKHSLKLLHKSFVKRLNNNDLNKNDILSMIRNLSKLNKFMEFIDFTKLTSEFDDFPTPIYVNSATSTIDDIATSRYSATSDMNDTLRATPRYSAKSVTPVYSATSATSGTNDENSIKKKFTDFTKKITDKSLLAKESVKNKITNTLNKAKKLSQSSLESLGNLSDTISEVGSKMSDYRKKTYNAETRKLLEKPMNLTENTDSDMEIISNLFKQK
jgi:hypothetical protein